ncbi:hypothetical protein [Natronorubrum sp. A-ect3]|uniref:hypothetical protein n=1 Tax=Natronorubrum sp. A-ect3 TaxID=3242698 RepID=UPI00359E3FCA
MSEKTTFAEFIGTGESPIIIHDTQLEKRDRMARAQLRSVPFFLEFGFGDFLYDPLWAREFQLVEHEHGAPSDVTLSSEAFPLVHLVTSDQLKPPHEQELDQEYISQADVTWDLFRAAKTDSPYVLVSDTDSPHIPSRTPSPGRSVADQFNAITFEYEQLIHDYVKRYVDSELPLHDTKNLYFHRISECHAKHDAPAATLTGLFEYDQAPPDSPIWEPLYYFIEHELEELFEEYTAHVTQALRSWIEQGDTEKIAKRMIATLHRCNFDAEQLAEYQNDPNR